MLAIQVMPQILKTRGCAMPPTRSAPKCSTSADVLDGCAPRTELQKHFSDANEESADPDLRRQIDNGRDGSRNWTSARATACRVPRSSSQTPPELFPLPQAAGGGIGSVWRREYESATWPELSSPGLTGRPVFQRAVRWGHAAFYVYILASRIGGTLTSRSPTILSVASRASP